MIALCVPLFPTGVTHYSYLLLLEELPVDLTGPIIDVTGWRGGSPASVENSSSSLSKDTHSSLDTQDEDEELACSEEEPVQGKPLCCVDEHLASKDSYHCQAVGREWWHLGGMHCWCVWECVSVCVTL